ncbi:hypothetical protein HK105_202636 [Polyrhizophydium stewartii]|uniref:Uncharacterized protein n=1 Tax=Polyrhizophydium stewartii TaxID=2732419 RepID=A0ABR4NE22_9FUNG
MYFAKTAALIAAVAASASASKAAYGGYGNNDSTPITTEATTPAAYGYNTDAPILSGASSNGVPKAIIAAGAVLVSALAL